MGGGASQQGASDLVATLECPRGISVVWSEKRTLSWEVQAVNSGSFAVYVVVLPFGATTVAAEKLVASPMVKTRGRAAIHAESGRHAAGRSSGPCAARLRRRRRATPAAPKTLRFYGQAKDRSTRGWSGIPGGRIHAERPW